MFTALFLISEGTADIKICGLPVGGTVEAKGGHKLECFKENRNVFVEIDRGESLITADIPCKYGADPSFAQCT